MLLEDSRRDIMVCGVIGVAARFRLLLLLLLLPGDAPCRLFKFSVLGRWDGGVGELRANLGIPGLAISSFVSS